MTEGAGLEQRSPAVAALVQRIQELLESATRGGLDEGEQPAGTAEAGAVLGRDQGGADAEGGLRGRGHTAARGKVTQKDIDRQSEREKESVRKKKKEREEPA